MASLLVATGRELRTLKGHEYWVHGVTLSRNGRLAISTSYEQTLKVWNVETGEVLTRFTCQSAVATSILVSLCWL